ncbi:hypothetical protein AO726_15175 [Pseudomonas sp. TTU2014-080ASC]|nr:hypothetical protein AO726_15175 [Pseudomonas sp. TTU2014-080ASC]
MGISSSFLLVGATAAEISGVIRFTGSIVEGSCDVIPVHDNVQANCQRNGQDVISRHALELAASAPQPLPESIGTSQLNWLDVSRKQGILLVSYN